VEKAPEHPKAVAATVLLRELAHEFEHASQIARDQGDTKREKEHRLSANRFWNAIDCVNRA
jgi:hypothetical protein